jgi:hypothetical protein
MKTLTENQVMKIFNRNKKQMIKLLGDQVTDNQTLEKTGLNLMGSKFKGVYAVDTIPMNKPGLFIINTDVSSGDGVHWVGLKITAKRIYVFDSFGRTTDTLLRILVKKAKKANKQIIDCDYDADQQPAEMICGQLSLAWLMLVTSHGIKNALKV